MCDLAIRYFVTGNTAEGFVNYTDSNIKDMERVIVLNHNSDKVKTSVVREIVSKHQSDENIEILLSSRGEKYLDGVLLKNSSTAILMDHIAPVERDYEVLDLEKVANSHINEQEKEKQQEHIQQSMQVAYENFATGLSIHDKLENVYVEQMDFDRADELADTFIQELVGATPEQKKKGKLYERLFGTNTPDGAVNVVPEIIEPITNVTFIKGRAGTGKSTFMKKVVAACVNRGMDVEQYRCSFDPNGIDMVIVRELDFCIFDSTDPHEFSPRNEQDHIIDLYEETLTKDTDVLFAEQIRELTSHYKSYMKQGVQCIQEAGSARDLLEEKYTVPSREKLRQFINHYIG